MLFSRIGATEPLEDRNREDRDRDRRAHRQPGAQPEVDGRGAEDQPEERAEDDRFGGELGGRLAGGNAVEGGGRTISTVFAGCAMRRSLHKNHRMPKPAAPHSEAPRIDRIEMRRAPHRNPRGERRRRHD